MNSLFRGFIASLFLLALSHAIQAQVANRSDIQARIESLRAELQQKENVFLAPAPEDVQAFAAFLSQPETGMTRLMPRETYDKNLLTRGGGAFFSFGRLTHEYGRGSNLALQQNLFSAGFAGADFGFLTSLGDTPIGDLAASHPAVAYLAGIVAPDNEPEARLMQLRAATGVEQDGFSYKNAVPASPNTTYVLRSVSYDESDLLLAFRVTRRDQDGSMLILWKILSRFAKPKLAR